jgi:hypothetical protein
MVGPLGGSCQDIEPLEFFTSEHLRVFLRMVNIHKEGVLLSIGKQHALPKTA